MNHARFFNHWVYYLLIKCPLLLVPEHMAVDHIFPVDKITKLSGFNKLTMEQQIAIIHDTVGIGNFQPLPKTFNSSKKSSLNWSEYKKQQLSSAYKQTLMDTQVEIEEAIKRQIAIFHKFNAVQKK